MDIEFADRIELEHLPAVRDLFWAAFGEKLQRPLGDKQKALDYVFQSLHPDNILVAHDGEKALGVAAFSDNSKPLTRNDYQVMRRVYGPVSGLVRLLLMWPLEASYPKDTLYVEYLAVSPAARGRGVGSRLLEQVDQVARRRGLTKVGLDVVDHNERAAQLYERLGFVPGKTQSLGPLGRLYGFRSSTVMSRAVPTAGDS